jgi:hypothetical protein
MKAQWQIVDVETGKAIKVEGEIELVDFCKEYFDNEILMSYLEARLIFGDIDSIKNPIGILNYKETP